MKQAKKLFDIFNKLDKRVFLVILILIPMFLAFFFRAYPAYLPVTDQWAENTVENNLKNQLASQLNSRYPNLPPQNRQALLDQEYENYYYANKDHIDSQVKSTSDYFKSQLQNDAGETYFLAIDPYIYLMDAESLSELGHVGDEIVDGQSFESRQNAPLGSVRTSNPHSNLMVILSKFINIFKPVSLMGGSFWLPAILAALATIPAFLITRRKAGVLGGFVAATIVGVHGAFLGRTPAGFVDTDVYNVFFPLLIAWLLLESFESKDFKWKLGLGMLSGI